MQTITAYLADNNILTDWQGKEIGRYRITSSWKVNSYVTDRMHQVDAVVDGVKYTGRSAGVGMYFNGRAKKAA